MSEVRRFHLPLPTRRLKSSTKFTKSQDSQCTSPDVRPSSCESIDQDDTITALNYNHLKSKSIDHTNMSSPRPSRDANEIDIQRALAALATNMATPSRNNFARRSHDDTNFGGRYSSDITSPSPIIEYDLGQGFFAADQSMENSHRRNKSSESSYSSRWWKLSRMRHHPKSSSASSHPTIDTSRAISSRSSSITSMHGTDVDARSSTTSFAQHRTWLDKQSPTASPQPDHFTFPVPRVPHYSQSSLELRQAYSRDGHRKPDGLASLHSAQSSLSSFGHSRQKSAQSLDSPTKFVIPMQDKWSMQLGHANYTIYPEPYALASYDLQMWQNLLEDYDAAQSEYCKHKARTIEHYGINTETFKLTELKWADINAEWERNIDIARKQLLARGIASSELTATSTSHLVRMPALNPHMDGKFPKLGDEDIVGPMAQSEPLYSREPSPARKSTHHKWKLFGKSGSHS